jgi:hypothetical protein
MTTIHDIMQVGDRHAGTREIRKILRVICCEWKITCVRFDQYQHRFAAYTAPERFCAMWGSMSEASPIRIYSELRVYKSQRITKAH